MSDDATQLVRMLPRSHAGMTRIQLAGRDRGTGDVFELGLQEALEMRGQGIVEFMLTETEVAPDDRPAPPLLDMTSGWHMMAGVQRSGGWHGARR